MNPPYLKSAKATFRAESVVFVDSKVNNISGESSGVTGHRSNTLDNQYGATITISSASGASLPLCKRAEEGKQLETV